MSRHTKIATTLLGCIACLFAAAHAYAAEAPPNILFIFADDWGFGDLSCHGNEIIETPNLDKLASQGMNIKDFTVASGVCSPSRTAVMTGHFPARYSINQHFHHVQHHRKTNMPDWLDPDAPMLPRQLKQAGYATFHVGKWHLTGTPVTDAPHPTAYGYDKSWVWNGQEPRIKAHEVWDITIDLIKEKRDKPFFINLWLNETHTPHFPTQKWLDYYAEKGLDERERVYPAVASNADELIGKVLQALEDSGQTDNTLVIFTSDNGPEYPLDRRGKKMKHPDLGNDGLNTWYSLGSAGDLRGKKRSLHEGGIRVPFIMRWPEGIKKVMAYEYSALTAVDLLPTLCKIAGADLPQGYAGDGEDRSNLLNAEFSPRTKHIFWYWPVGRGKDNWPQAAIRENGLSPWKLLMTLDGERVELYQMWDDPNEETNLAADQPEVVVRLKSELEAWLSELPEGPDPKSLSELRKQ